MVYIWFSWLWTLPISKSQTSPTPRGGGETGDDWLYIQGASFEPIDRVEAVLIAVADLNDNAPERGPNTHPTEALPIRGYGGLTWLDIHLTWTVVRGFCQTW
jgi:hypothetical protein